MKIIFILCHFIFALFMSPVFAVTGAIFFYPDIPLLIDMTHLVNDNCPSGQVRLIPNTFINVSRYTCEEYCPSEWTWVSRSDGFCHDYSDLRFSEYRITPHPDGNEVSALYGKRNSGKIYFEYVLKIPSDKNWSCNILKGGIDLVSCHIE